MLIRKTSLWFAVCLGVSTRAMAGDNRLVVAGDPELARARLAGGASLPPDQIRALTLAESLPKQPLVLVGPGKLDACAGKPSTNAEIREAADSAEKLVAYVEFDQALGELDIASSKLGCLGEPADGALAARVYFLQGVVAHGRGDSASADAAFRLALAFKPDLRWDENFPPDAVPLFEAAKVGSAAPTHLAVVPAPAAVWVDGRTQPGGGVDVSPGVHLVQFGEPLVTWRVYVDPGSSVGLVRPSSVPADAALWSKDLAKRSDLGFVLGAAFGTGQVIYVDDTETTWATTSGVGDWVAVAGAAKAKADADKTASFQGVDTAALVATTAAVLDSARDDGEKAGAKRKKGAIGSGLLIGGALIMAGGGTFSGLQYGAAKSASVDADQAIDADDWNGWSTAAETYGDHRALYTAGIALSAVGLGTALGGTVAFVVRTGPTPTVGIRGRW